MTHHPLHAAVLPDTLTPNTLQALLQARLREAFAATVIQAAARRFLAIASTNRRIATAATEATEREDENLHATEYFDLSLDLSVSSTSDEDDDEEKSDDDNYADDGPKTGDEAFASPQTCDADEPVRGASTKPQPESVAERLRGARERTYHEKATMTTAQEQKTTKDKQRSLDASYDADADDNGEEDDKDDIMDRDCGDKEGADDDDRDGVSRTARGSSVSLSKPSPSGSTRTSFASLFSTFAALDASSASNAAAANASRLDTRNTKEEKCDDEGDDDGVFADARDGEEEKEEEEEGGEEEEEEEEGEGDGE